MRLFQRKKIGFRKGSRTQDHILVLKSVIDKYISKLDKLYVCFVDFALLLTAFGGMLSYIS